MVLRRRPPAPELVPDTEPDAAAPSSVTAGKGRPTPKRSEARGRRRSAPLTGKEATAARRAKARQTRAAQRDALATGDERNLPPRDAGPARRLARDSVDSRFSVGQILFGLIIVVFLLSLLNSPVIRLASNVVALVLLAVIVLDGTRHARRARNLVAGRFGPMEAHGIAQYALLRALMPRRMRRPPPKVTRGETVS